MLDITTLAAWGEFLGGVGVIASLIYLASQVRMNTRTVRASNFGDLLTANNEAVAARSDLESVSLWIRALEDYAGLGPEERLRVHYMMIPDFNNAYLAWNLYRQGLLDASLLDNWMRALVSRLEKPGARQWWEAAQEFWQPEFRAFVQEKTEV